MNRPHLVYFADPMCSWCWGFSPVITAIRQHHGADLPIRLVMGGLRPGTKEPMSEASKREIRGHWEHVEAASGQPFDYGLFDRDGSSTTPSLPPGRSWRSAAPRPTWRSNFCAAPTRLSMPRAVT